MARRYDYREGSEAKERFDAGMKALFQVRKSAMPEKKKARKKRAKKTAGHDRDSGGEV